MIPKTIHYCWFGRNPLPKLAEKCIASWKKYCPDYEIIQWNEDNFDLSSMPLYVRQAYEAKKWAYVTDYVRLWLIHEYGGIYMDTDVELLKPLDVLLDYTAYFGYEDGKHVNTGLGFGAEKGTPILREMMEDYSNIPFLKENGEFDMTTCPKRNTEIFVRNGLKQDNTLQFICYGVVVFPREYFCPVRDIGGTWNITENTYSIHHFMASWLNLFRRKKDRIIHLPNRILRWLLGGEKYEKLKLLLRRKPHS